MALEKRCGSIVNRANEGFGLGFVRFTRSMRGKRIALSDKMEVDSTTNRPTMNQQGQGIEQTIPTPQESLLEALPEEILISVLCCVDHDDLKQLFRVSKTIREATLIAKQRHFAYSTPAKTSAFRNSIDLGDAGDFEGVEFPNAPKFFRSSRSRLGGKKLGDISVALFASSEDCHQWPRIIYGNGNTDPGFMLLRSSA